MRTEVKNQIWMLGNAVASEVSVDHEPHRTWLWLGPYEGRLELRRVQQVRGVYPEEWPSPGFDPHVVERERFDSLDAALEVLERRGIDTDKFDAFWKSSSPF